MKVDYAQVPARHESINKHLENWARWVRVRPKESGTMQPIFRNIKRNRMDFDSYSHIPINPIAAQEIERAVSLLPDKHRTAIRWCYVFQFLPPHIVTKELGVTKNALCQLIDDGRDMVLSKLENKYLHNLEIRAYNLYQVHTP